MPIPFPQIQNPGGFLIQPTSATEFRPLRDWLGDTINVKSFGAKGDYVVATDTGTDDTAAIQAAIDAAVTNKHVLYFPPGVYLVTSSLTLPVYPATLRIVGGNSFYYGDGSRGGTHIHSKATSLFVPATASQYAAWSKCCVQIEGFSFQAAGVLGATGIVFDSMNLSASVIQHCLFHSFKNILYGILSGVSKFKHNWVVRQQGDAFARATTFSADIRAYVDSEISSNYFNGDADKNDVTLLDLQSASAMLVADNYLDFAYRGIYTGSGNGLVTIRDNVFDILYRAIDIGYGGKDLSISGNRFYRIAKAGAATYFTAPTAEMIGNDWVCINYQRYVKDVSVYGNTIRKCDRFMVLTDKWYRNLREWGNVGSHEYTAPIVTMTSRTVDEAGWNAVGQTGDGTLFRFDSMEGQTLTATPDTVKASYGGHSFVRWNCVMYNRAGQYLDAFGTRFFGRTNLSPAAPLTDYTGGWVASGGVTFPGGVLTAAGPGGWVYTGVLASALTAGTYLVVFRIATFTSGAGSYLSAGLYLDDGSTVPTADTEATAVGTWYHSVVVPAGRTATKLAMFASMTVAFTGTSDDYFIVKMT